MQKACGNMGLSYSPYPPVMKDSRDLCTRSDAFGNDWANVSIIAWKSSRHRAPELRIGGRDQDEALNRHIRGD